MTVYGDDIPLINNTDVWSYDALIATLYGRLISDKTYCPAARDLPAPILWSFRYF